MHPQRLFAILLVLLGACFAPGCDRNDKRIVADSPTAWKWEGDFFDGHSESQNYFWDTVLEQVQVKVEADEFEGDIRVQIYDLNEERVFNETWVGNGNDLNDYEFSAFGAPGVWRIDIRVTGVSGTVTVRLVGA